MIYLDSSATTQVSPAAAQKMLQAATELWGNPSSLHHVGLAAEKILEEARGRILSALGIRVPNSKNLIFCGSGTEANNLALFGTAHAKTHNRGKRIIVSDSEHPSILEPAKRLQEEGYDLVTIPTQNGMLDLDALSRALEKETVLFSCMLVNNETGARYAVEQAFSLAKKRWPNIVTHCDAVQGFLKVKFTPDTLHADMISISSHKLHGPKGVGALYVATPILTSRRLTPYILGGGQENGMRSGTENIPGIAAFGEAVQTGFQIERAAIVRDYLLAHLPAEVTANLPIGERAPHIVSLLLPGIRSETMLHFLSASDICVSSGSACASNTGHGSYVLKAFGLTPKQADSTIRISFDDAMTIDQIDTFLEVLQKGVSSLVRNNK